MLDAEFFISGRPNEFVARRCFQTASNSHAARNVLPDSGDAGRGKLRVGMGKRDGSWIEFDSAGRCRPNRVDAASFVGQPPGTWTHISCS